MDESTTKTLQEQNEKLRSFAASVSATLLRKVAMDFEMRGSLGRADAERLIREADDCFRCSRLSGLRTAIAEGLEAAGHELMSMAVEIETRLQRGKKEG